MLTLCCSKRCMSGLDLELLMVLLYVVVYLIICFKGIMVNMTWALFRDKMWKHSKEYMPSPLFGRLVRCSAHGCSFVRLQYSGQNLDS